MDWYLYPLTVLAGFLAGFINTLAGGGSAISLAMLNLLGLPLDVANGTNRIAILLQNIVAVRGFHKRGKMDAKACIPLIWPAVLGGILGAWLAGRMGRESFRMAVGVLMLVVLALLFIQPRRWLQDQHVQKKSNGLIPFVVFFAIGIYGGFIQMGIGVFLLSALVLLLDYDLVGGNGAKVLIVLCLTLPALLIFLFNGLVRWDYGLVLACGNMLGAWIATKEAARRGAPFVRAVLIAVVSLAALRYLGILRYIVNALSSQ